MTVRVQTQICREDRLGSQDTQVTWLNQSRGRTKNQAVTMTKNDNMPLRHNTVQVNYVLELCDKESMQISDT
jgi:hypothetical protein